MENTFITLITVMLLMNGAFLIWNIIKKRRIQKHKLGLKKLKKFRKKQIKVTQNKKQNKVTAELSSAAIVKDFVEADYQSGDQRKNRRQKLLVTMGDISEAPEDDPINLS